MKMKKMASRMLAGTVLSLGLLMSSFGQENLKPTVSFLSPDRDLDQPTSMTISIIADPEDADGKIANLNLTVLVEHTGEILTYDVTSEPYEFGPFVFSSPGRYIFTLLATDMEGAISEPAVRNIDTYLTSAPPGLVWYGTDTTSKPAIQSSTGAPTISSVELSLAEGPFYTNANDDVATLTANVEGDPEGKIFTYRWWQLSGPVQLEVEEGTETSSVATFSGFSDDHAGTYEFEVAVSDGLNSAQKTVSVTYTSPSLEVFPTVDLIYPQKSQYYDAEHGLSVRLYIDTTNYRLTRFYMSAAYRGGFGEIDQSYSIEDYREVPPNDDYPPIYTDVNFYEFRMGDMALGGQELQLYADYVRLVDGEPQARRYRSQRVQITATLGPRIVNLAGNTVFVDLNKIKTANVPIKLSEQTTLTVEAAHPENDELIYSWRQLSGPMLVNLEEDTTKPSLQVGKVDRQRGGFFLKGNYVFEVKVEDEKRGNYATSSRVAEYGLVTVSVTDEPQVPVAQDLTVNVLKGTSIDITLKGTDANGDAITYNPHGPLSPGIGTLTGTEPNLTYTAGSTNVDTEFTYSVKDEATTSPDATVTIQVWDTIEEVRLANRGPEEEDSGCGCATTDGTNGTVWLIAAIFLGFAVRRRSLKHS